MRAALSNASPTESRAMKLARFQKQFTETMFRPVRDIQEYESDFKALFSEGEIPLDERLKVYHNNVVGSLSEVMRATFPLLENLVGEDFLKSMARGFIFENPPNSGCMHMYGAGFDEFIKTYEPAKSLSYLSDVATLELALNTAYYASDDVALAPDALAQVPPESLGEVVLNLRSSATLISSSYPLQSIRSFCLDTDNNSAPDLTEDYTCRLMILRPALEVNIITLSEDEFEMLHLLHNKVSLGAAVEKTMTVFPTFDFTAFLQKHTALESFTTL